MSFRFKRVFGVDVFFTISGFLIFSSLLNRVDSGKGLELGEYFLKRFRRIYPALFALIPISVTLAWLVNRDMLVGIRNQIMTVLLGCYNWYAISSGASYFSQMNLTYSVTYGSCRCSCSFI